MVNTQSCTKEKTMNLKQIEEEIKEDWLIEAGRRARELDEGIVQPIPAEEVRLKARVLLR